MSSASGSIFTNFPTIRPGGLVPDPTRRQFQADASAGRVPRYYNAAPTDPQRVLFESLQNSWSERNGRFTTTVKATLTRNLFWSICASPEWLGYFMMDGDKWLHRTLGEWLVRDDLESSVPWSLRDHQRRVKAKRKVRDPPRLGRVCPKTLPRYTRIFTCKTCGLDGTGNLCVDCFRAGDHEGHEVLFSQTYSFASACDCGHPGGWKEGHMGCRLHPPLPPGTEVPERKPFVTDRQDIPPELINAITETVTICIEFIIETLQHSLLQSDFGKLPKNEEEMRKPFVQTGQPLPDRGKGPWSVVLWTDDKHVAKEVTRQIRDATGCNWDHAERLTREAEYIGRKTILTSPNPIQAFHVASMLQQIDLGVTLRSAFDVFREEAIALIMTWLLDMCQTSIGGDDDLFLRILFKVLNEPRFQTTQDGGNATDGYPGTSFPTDLKELEYPPWGRYRRLDWIMQLDIKMWKRAKFQWRELYSLMYALGWETRRELAGRFAFNYVRLFEQFVYQDRESDTNLLYVIGYMVFENGPAAAYATQTENLFGIVLDVAYAFYTNQLALGRLIMPPQEIQRTVDRKEVEESPAFRGKKGIYIFGHIRALLRHREMQILIAGDPTLFLKVAKFLNMFVGMQTQTKELKSHIEFEVDWPRTFTHLSELAKAARELGETLKHATPEIVLSNIAAVAAGIFADLTLQSDTLNPEKYRPPKFMLLQDVLIPGHKIEVLAVDTIHMEAFSFHHYLNLLFAESIKHLRTLPWRDGKYRDLSPQQVLDRLCLAPLGVDPDLMKLVVFEWSIQKLAILAHIKADLWRRNGVGMRGQLHHYREVGVREATVDLEFWTLQFSLCVCEPLLPLRLFVTLVNRWGLTSFFTDDVLSSHQWSHELMDPKQRVVLAEDFLMLCIYLLCDMSIAQGWDQRQLTRSSLIHILALNTMGYSEILKKMPERSTETSFLDILNEIAEFRPATDTVLGAYTLKPEYLDQIDPYWRHYTRNDQRIVIDKILARKKKLHPEVEEPFIQPHPLSPPGPDSPFHNVVDWAKGEVIAHIVHYAIAHCMPIADPAAWTGVPYLRNMEGMPQLDLLLDLTLHLAMLALQGNAHGFAMASVDLVEGSNAMSIFQNLWFMQTNDNFKAWRPRVNFIMKKIIEQLPEAYTQDYFKQQEGLAEAMANEPVVAKPDLKGAAAARQKAIMQEFAKKQADFAAFMDVGEDEDEDIQEETSEVYGQCIVCQEDVTPKHTGGMLALLQPSRILRDVVVDRDWFEESLAVPASLDRNTRYHRFGGADEPTSTEAYPANNCRFGVYMSACSHLMHDTCVITYFDATRLRHVHQVQRHQPENLVRMEYLCPLCKSLGNVLVPLDPTPTPLRPYIHPRVRQGGAIPSVSEKIRQVSNECLLQVKESAKIWDHHVETGELNVWFADTNFATQTMDPAYRKSIKPNTRMIERVRSLMRPLSEQSQRLRHKKTYMYLPDDLVAYTVSVCEIAQRGFQTPGLTVAEQVPENSMKLIKQLIGHLQLELDLFFGPRFDRTPLRVGIFARLLPDWFRASSLPSPLLMRNPLTLVIEAAAIAPDLLHSVISMAYYAELTRAMLGLSMWIRRCLTLRTRPHARTYPPKDPHLREVFELFERFRPIMQTALKTHAGGFTDTDGLLALVTDHQLAKLLYTHTLPFLRRAAIVFYAVAGQYPDPTASANDGGDMGEYKRLLGLLHIPPPVETLSNPNSTESTMVSRWLTSWSLQGRMVPPVEYPGTYELLRLPTRWEDVMLQYTETKCEKCNSKPNFPALCLYCGAFLCLGGDCCKESEQGECNIHMRDCGGATGMFVDIKRWLLVIMYAGSGSFGPMPYLDAHGELDVSQRRGHRLYMHIGRMDEVRKSTWLQHTIPHLAARKLELASDGGGWGTL